MARLQTSSIPLTPPIHRVCEPLGPEWDEIAATILAPCTSMGTAEAGQAALRDLRQEDGATLYALIDGGALVAAYALRKNGLALEIAWLVVAPDQRRRGFGRTCLHDALRRAGKRPLVAEADDDSLPFYRGVGFKLVGKRRAPNGSTRFRLSWHSPRPGAVEASRT